MALALLALACSVGSGGDQQATVDALAASVAGTATAAAEGEISSADRLLTAQVEATEQFRLAAASQTAEASLSEAELAATATAFAPFAAELPTYGVDPASGRPAWIHPPVRFELEGFMQNDAQNQFIGTVVRDFVLSADLTWDTQFGTSGCGFVLRSDGNEEAPNHYLVIATRASLGHIIFTTQANGEVAYVKDIFPGREDPEFDWQNGSTNRLTIVGRGLLFEIYTNGVKVGEVTGGEPPLPPVSLPPPPTPTGSPDDEALAAYQAELEKYEEEITQARGAFRSQQSAYDKYNTKFERGFVAMVALSESGRTVCEFNNAWLWRIEP